MSNKTKPPPKPPQIEQPKDARGAAKLAAKTVIVATGAGNLVASVLYELLK